MIQTFPFLVSLHFTDEHCRSTRKRELVTLLPLTAELAMNVTASQIKEEMQNPKFDSLHDSCPTNPMSFGPDVSNDAV
jgi:hypothetical protein